MPTNSLAGVNPTRIAQLSLDVLLSTGVALSAFTTDFSSEVAQSGDKVVTRFAEVKATQDFDAGKTPGDTDTIARTITIDQYRGVSLGFKDTERAFSDIELINDHIAPAIEALVDEMIEHTLSNVTAADFGGNKEVLAAGALDGDAVADLAEGLSTRKVPKNNRSLIIKPTYFSTLAKDSTISAASDGPNGTGAIRDYVIPRVRGFNVHEYNGTIPASDLALAGLACGKQALCIAQRAVPHPTDWYGQCRDIVDPNSGLQIQMRSYYDGVNQVYEFGSLYGSTVGISDYATAIVSA